jgi:hypothetical protein
MGCVWSLIYCVGYAGNWCSIVHTIIGVFLVFEYTLDALGLLL